VSVFMQDKREWIQVDPRTWEYNYAFAYETKFRQNTYFEERGKAGAGGNYTPQPTVPAARVRIVKKDAWAIDLPTPAHSMFSYAGWATITTVPTYDEATGLAQLLVATKEKS
jgi:hypothetical protein